SSIMDFNVAYTPVRDPEPFESERIWTGLVAAISVVSVATLLDVGRLTLVPLYIRTVGQNLRDRGTTDRARVAVWVIAVVFVATSGVELLVRLRSRHGHLRNDDTRVAFLLAFALAASRLLMLVAGLFSLSRARAALTRHLSAAVRAELP